MLRSGGLLFDLKGFKTRPELGESCLYSLLLRWWRVFACLKVFVLFYILLHHFAVNLHPIQGSLSVIEALRCPSDRRFFVLESINQYLCSLSDSVRHTEILMYLLNLF